MNTSEKRTLTSNKYPLLTLMALSMFIVKMVNGIAITKTRIKHAPIIELKYSFAFSKSFLNILMEINLLAIDVSAIVIREI